MLTVKFQSDETVHREGFTAHYVQLDQTKGKVTPQNKIFVNNCTSNICIRN